MAPDPLQDVLGADARFAAAGFDAWMLEEHVTPALRVAIRQRQQDEARLLGLTPRSEPNTPAPLSLHSVRERLLALAVTLADVAPAPGDRLVYEYDFGDGWEHDLLVEKVLELEPGATYPVCIKRRRACPPEDVGGIWGYAEFLEILSDPDHPEYEERLEWVGGEFDPEEFDVEDVNAAFASLAI